MRLTVLLVVSTLMAGCASTPKISANYYGTRTALDLRVIRTVGCDVQNRAILASSVTSTVVQSADPSVKRTIDFSRLSGALANSEFALEWTVDGRLKSINAESTGQGETILKAAIKLAGTLLEEGATREQ